MILKEANEKMEKLLADIKRNQISYGVNTPSQIESNLAIKQRLQNYYNEAINWNQRIKHPSVIMILGTRGSGKSALGYMLLEYMRFRASPYVLGMTHRARQSVPEWIGNIPSLEFMPNKSIILIDESYILAHSRSSSSHRSRMLSNLINLSRHKEQTLIFVTQEARQIDKNIASSANIIIVKNPGILRIEFERKELRKVMTEAQRMLSNVNKDKNRFSYVYAPESDFPGMMENSLPSFWTPDLSKSYVDTELINEVNIPRRMTREEKIKVAKEYRRQGFSLKPIGDMLGNSKPTIKNYLDDYPYRKK